jgi:hypothetical protein
MSSAPMDAVMAELGANPHPSVQQKAAIVIRMLEVWRGRARRGLAILERDWQAYLPRHVAEAGAAAVVLVCREWRDRDLQQLTETSNLVKLQSGRPEVADWERRLDRARRGLLSVLPEEAKTTDTCLGPVVDNGREVNAVSQQVFTAVLADVPIPPQARLDAAQTSGVADAIVLAQRLMAEPRDLKLKATTPEADRIASQPIAAPQSRPTTTLAHSVGFPSPSATLYYCQSILASLRSVTDFHHGLLGLKAGCLFFDAIMNSPTFESLAVSRWLPAAALIVLHDDGGTSTRRALRRGAKKRGERVDRCRNPRSAARFLR